jgi:hypothetical protein
VDRTTPSHDEIHDAVKAYLELVEGEREYSILLLSLIELGEEQGYVEGPQLQLSITIPIPERDVVRQVFYILDRYEAFMSGRLNMRMRSSYRQLDDEPAMAWQNPVFHPGEEVSV